MTCSIEATWPIWCPEPSDILIGGKISPDDFRPYEPDKKDIAYPPTDFVDQLMKLKEPGDSLVVADQPVKHYYVAVLTVKPQVPDLARVLRDLQFLGGQQAMDGHDECPTARSIIRS